MSDIDLIGFITVATGVILGVLRLLNVSVAALHAVLPAKYHWVPDTLLIGLGGAAVALPNATDWWGVAEVALGLVALLVVAYAQGGHTPEQSSDESKQ